ncbi:MAG: protein-export chaperone SecB [Candidatus Cloacimonadota bacterium]|nr:protein-export chaperone SecB [Candidatus Cloacimonadota bacterium]
MNEKQQPGIKFENIYLIEDSFKRIPIISQRLDIKLDFDIERHIEKGKSFIKLKTYLNLINEKNENEVEIEFSYIANFKEIKGNENMKIADFLENNAPALMFPYIRQHIHNKTTIAGLKPLILPPINIVALLNERKTNEQNENV